MTMIHVLMEFTSRTYENYFPEDWSPARCAMQIAFEAKKYAEAEDKK